MTATIFLIIVAAFVFIPFIAITEVPALEKGLISPPVGMNVFIVKSLVPQVPMATIFRGTRPFWFAKSAMIVLLIMFPQIALYLRETIANR